MLMLEQSAEILNRETATYAMTIITGIFSWSIGTINKFCLRLQKQQQPIQNKLQRLCSLMFYVHTSDLDL